MAIQGNMAEREGEKESWETAEYIARNKIIDFYLKHPEKEAEKESGKRRNKRQRTSLTDVGRHAEVASSNMAAPHGRRG